MNEIKFELKYTLTVKDYFRFNLWFNMKMIIFISFCLIGYMAFKIFSNSLSFHQILVIIFAYIGLLILFFIFSFLIIYILSQIIYNQDRILKSECNLILTETKIEENSLFSQTKIEWNQLKGIVFFYDHIFLLISNIRAFIIPKKLVDTKLLEFIKLKNDV